MYTKGEKIIPVYIEDEMKGSYIDYAMSVIVGRALPDIRDGLKPVHRRILYTMKELNLWHNKPYKKCARIVGSCLGQYHPHGDTAVYDALVRMVQDFSLRYPLIDGQGNFGCFTKDIKIKLCDGRNLTFIELIKEQGEGKRHWGFSFNLEAKKIEVAEIKKPRLTRKKEEIIEITLDNNEKVKCTLDHKFMLKDGRYKKAKDLKSGDSLMPLYIESYEGEDLDLKSYDVVYQPTENRWNFVHRLADAWNLKNKIYQKSAGRIRHHLDFNKLNNSPDNIQRIQWKDHWRLHVEHASALHKDPEYQKRIAAGRKRFWSNKKNRTKAAERLSERNRKNWQNAEYRERMRKMLSNVNIEFFKKHPELREEKSRRLKELWTNKNYREIMSKVKSEELKERWKEKNYRRKMTSHMREISRKIWADPAHKKYISKLMKEKFNSPEMRQRQSEISKTLWQNPEYRSKFSKTHFKEMAKILWQNPNTAQFHREKAKRQWQDPEFRKKVIKSVKASSRRRIKENPNLLKTMTEKARISLREKWKNPSYKERVIKSKILSYVKSLSVKYPKVTAEVYESERRNNGVPKLEKALYYFDGFDDLARCAKSHNHKVVKTKILSQKEDVYDLTIEPWHNFALNSGIFVHNSIDGDPAAAQRYTEAKLEAIAEEMLKDIDKDTVDFTPNFDSSLKEPTVLPAALPNLLINGSSGIAVGMATNIPSHNLAEVVSAIVKLIDEPEAAVKDLMRHIKGPDFPTGGIICGREGIKSAYSRGRGLIKVRAKAYTETSEGGKESIIITELPYQVNKTTLIEQIADLIQNKKIEGVSDLRDESSKEGIRMVLDLRKNQNAQVILNKLYKHTQLEITFGIIMLALVDSQPRVLNLKQILSLYIDYRKEVITRRTRFELNKAEARAHILEGLKIALKHLDEIIKTIKKSKDPEKAKIALVKKFSLTEKQAQAILEMQLQRLTNLERDKIEKEYLDLIKKIETLKSILESPKKVLQIIKEGVLELKKKYEDPRRTDIIGKIEELDIEDLIAEESMVITVSHSGYIKRMPVSSYKKQKRGGKGITGTQLKEEDFIEHLFVASTHNYILFFTDKGQVYWLKVHEIPQSGRMSKGRAIVNLLEISKDENITSFIPVSDFSPNANLVMATEGGIIKKTRLSAYKNPRKGGIRAITLRGNDRLMSCGLTNGKDEIILATEKGKAIRFDESEVRDMGRAASGVKSIRLAKKDCCIGMEIVKKGTDILTVTKKGFAKRTPVSKYRTQSRAGSGVINIKVGKRNGEVVGIKSVTEGDEIMVITSSSMVVRCAAGGIRSTGRNTQGVKLISLKPKDAVVSLAKIAPEQEGEKSEEQEEQL